MKEEPNIVLASYLCSREQDSFVKNVCGRQGWKLLSISTWTDLGCVVRMRSTGVVLIDREHLGVDWRACLGFLLQPEHRCCVLLAAPRRGGCFYEAFVDAGGYDVVNVPLPADELISAVERAWRSWKIISTAYHRTPMKRATSL